MIAKPVALHDVECGAGEPLVLLHGNGESGAYFARQMDAFAAHFHVYAVDTRGHGQSPRGEAPFTLDQFVEDLKLFLDKQRIDKAHLLGFSDGGNVALLFALRYPGRVDRLVLNGANLTPIGVKPAIQIPIAIGYGATCALAPISKTARAKKELLGLMVTQPHIEINSLAALRMPVLVLAGTHDMIRTAHTRRIAAAIPGAKLCLLNGDHFIAAKNPDSFNRAVLDFLIN